MSDFDYIQTFKINADAVARATDIMLTSIEVFFKGKPTAGSTISGQANPGINVWICEVVNNEPVVSRVINNSTLYIPYERINTSSTADSATVLGFENPVVLKTSSSYGLVIKFNDPAFDIWVNKQGDRLVTATGVTNNPSPGSQGRFDGNLYKSNNSGNYESFSDRDLKFKVNVAKFVSSSKTFSLVNKDYEFFTIDTTYTSTFQGGELVYQQTANATGTITTSVTGGKPTITGSGTTFTNHNVGDTIILVNGSVTDAVKITNIVSATVMNVDRVPNFIGAGNYKVPPVGAVYYTDYTKNRIILVDSSANSSNKFAAGNRFIGVRTGATANIASIDRWSVDHFKPTFMISNPSTSTYTLTYAMANSANQLGTSTNLELLKFNDATYDGYVLSRSTEVDTAKSSNLFGTNRKSVVANLNIVVNVDANNSFSVPYINTGQLDFFFYQNEINESTTETRTVTAGFPAVADYDTEVGKNGLGTSKYISKKINFAPDRYAEDVVVYLQGYRPAGSEIKVYAKIHNSADKESFDDKAWTPLVLKNNTDKFSSEDPNDLYEYTYGFQQYPDIDIGLSGSFLTGSSSNTIGTTVDQSAVVTTGDLIRIYDPLFPDNHEVFPVSSANSTAIVLFKPIENVALANKNVYIDKLKYRNTAWNNIANDNTVRYVSSSLVEFDAYSSMQIKIVLLSSSTYIIPKVEQIQVIGASA